MSLKERALRAAAMKAVSDALKAEVDSERSELMSELLDMYHDFGAKSFDVRMDGVKVASIPLSIPKPGPEVVDCAVFDAWVESTYPQAIVSVPASKTISPAFKEHLLGLITFTDTAAISPEGEIVPGVEWRESGDPKTFSIRFEKLGREAIAAAWSDGKLGALMPGIAPALPAVGQ